MNSVIVTVKCKNKKRHSWFRTPHRYTGKASVILDSLCPSPWRWFNQRHLEVSSVCEPLDGFSGMTKHWKTPVYGTVLF